MEGQAGRHGGMQAVRWKRSGKRVSGVNTDVVGAVKILVGMALRQSSIGPCRCLARAPGTVATFVGNWGEDAQLLPSLCIHLDLNLTRA